MRLARSLGLAARSQSRSLPLYMQSTSTNITERKRPYSQSSLSYRTEDQPPTFKQRMASNTDGSWRGGRSRGSSQPSSTSLGLSRGRGRGTPLRAELKPHHSKIKSRHRKVLPSLSNPILDKEYLTGSIDPGGEIVISSKWDELKSTLNNAVSQNGYDTPEYKTVNGTVDNIEYHRCTVVVDPEQNLTVSADAKNRRDAEKLAAYAGLLTLVTKGLAPNGAGGRSFGYVKSHSVKGVEDGVNPTSASVQLSDGSMVDYERARQFMDYYCRTFGFGFPDVSLIKPQKPGKRRTGWEATMMVGGAKIGFGVGANKKDAQKNCFLDVVQYLERCDNQLWLRFAEAAKTGKDLGLAPRVLLEMSDALNDDISLICDDSKRTVLYRNSPKGRNQGSSTSSGSNLPRPAPHVSKKFLSDRSESMSKRLKEYREDAQLTRMRETRQSLPVYQRAADVIDAVNQNDVLVVMAATGSGKTTQIPQILLDHFIDNNEGASCNIVCTQPRRIAAISVAERVAKERGLQVGSRSEIGYQVRFEAKLPEEHGSVTFCTTGIFLKRMQSNLQGEFTTQRSLDHVTHIVVDEVHERDVDTDLLLAVLRRLLVDRQARGIPLKLILMSATIDPTLFQQYFADFSVVKGEPAPIVSVPGRSFPVEKHFLDDFLPDLDPRSPVFLEPSVRQYLSRELGPVSMHHLNLPPLLDPPRASEEELEIPYPLVALTITHVLRKTDNGHVLVFLPGWDEISAVEKALADHRLKLIDTSDRRKFSIHLLHSSIPLAEQQVIFDPAPEGVRRIILSTNIAETSVTIPDVVYVVDTSRIKEIRYDPERHMSSLVTAWVGSSNLNQRAGRAGRHRPGEYYGILGQQRASELHSHQTVEMKRADLTNVVMHVKALDFPGVDVEEVLASTIEPPEPERVTAAMDDLKMVGAINHQKNLTSLGRVLLQLPVDVQVGRLVLFGSLFRCLDSALTLAAILTNRDPFMTPILAKREAQAVKDSWSPTEFRSDTLAILFAYREWYKMHSRGEHRSAMEFCHKNFLSRNTLVLIAKIKDHLLQSVIRAGVLDVSAGGRFQSHAPSSVRALDPEFNINGDSLPLLTALICIANQPKFAIRNGQKYRTPNDKITFIHPSSVNHRKRDVITTEGDTPRERLLYAYSDKRRNVSVVGGNSQTFLMTTTRLDAMTYILFGAYQIESAERGFTCDDWLPVVGNTHALDDIRRLKTVMETCMLRVFEGISTGRRIQSRSSDRRVNPSTEKESESESEDEEDLSKDRRLRDDEVQDLDKLTTDIVSVLERYSDERVLTQSRYNSRPATPGTPAGGSPFASPQMFSLSSLPPVGGSRSGYNTPAVFSRPSSRLSARW